jgi:NAD(P)-dependent dehydrogenase (short-subunit alcohol dehydrogenase family)
MALKGKVGVITGGAEGIGRAVAKRLLGDGMRLAIVDINEQAGKELFEELGCSEQLIFLHADISAEEDVRKVARETRRNFERVHLLVNNAGVFVRRPVTELSLDEWNRVIAVNLTGAFLCAKHFATYLGESNGSIVNIASTRAFMSERDTEAYSASKGGISALSHALAISLGPGVRVNCISPGWIETSQWKRKSERHEPKLTAEDHAQHPAGRVGRPEDIASLVAYLASEETSFITGANFIVDGGMTRKMIYL